MTIYLITELYPVDENDNSITIAVKNFVDAWDEEVFVFRPLQLSLLKISRFRGYFRLFNKRPDPIAKKQLVFILLIKIPFFRKYIYLLNKRLSLKPPDVILGHSLIGNHLANSMSKRYGVPFSAGLHNYDLQKLEKEENQYLKIFRRASLIACRSYSIKRRFNDFTKYRFDSLTFIANSGIDPSKVEDASFFSRKAREFDPEIIRFVTAARLEPLKNIDINIEVMSEMPQNFSYSIIGDGQDRDRIQAYIDRFSLGGRIRILGWKKQAEVLDYLKQSDIFIMASAPETFGLAYLEAMAKGCIVIGAYGWGIDGIIRKGENGYLVNAGDKESLKSVLNEIRSLTMEEREEIGRASRETVLLLSEQHVSDSYLNKLKELVIEQDGTPNH